MIPCYNEAKTVRKVVEDFKRALPEATIYVYDNNSTDKTAEIAREAGAVVRYERKQGKGNVNWYWWDNVLGKKYINCYGYTLEYNIYYI